MESGEFTAEKVRPSVSVRNAPTPYTRTHIRTRTDVHIHGQNMNSY